MLSGTSCGKKQVEVTDYGSESDNTSGTISDDASDSDSDEATNVSSSDYENLKSDGRSLTEIFGNNISVNEAFSAGGITADFDFDYKVPEASQVNVYEGSFIANDSDIEKQIVNNFFDGTEKELEEIKYVNDTDYIPLLYKYRSILMTQTFNITSTDVSMLSAEDYNEYMGTIDSSFDKVYKWADEATYYIHMYEGEYNGNRYGMIYSYDMASAKRNIYICPISMAEYFPDIDAETLFVVDQKNNLGSDNLCSMSQTDIMNDAFKKALENDPDISQRSSASLEVFSIAFTYVPAWYFLTKDNKQKSGEQSLTYSHVINALDGSDLTDSVK